MTQQDPSAAVTALVAGVAFIWILAVLAICAFMVFVYWRIASKAGYHGAWSLLLFVPLVNFIILLIFAFSRWPVEEEVLRLRAVGGTGGTAPVAVP